MPILIFCAFQLCSSLKKLHRHIPLHILQIWRRPLCCCVHAEPRLPAEEHFLFCSLRKLWIKPFIIHSQDENLSCKLSSCLFWNICSHSFLLFVMSCVSSSEERMNSSTQSWSRFVLSSRLWSHNEAKCAEWAWCDCSQVRSARCRPPRCPTRPPSGTWTRSRVGWRRRSAGWRRRGRRCSTRARPQTNSTNNKWSLWSRCFYFYNTHFQSDSKATNHLKLLLSSLVSARGAPGLREGALQTQGALRGGDAALQGGAGPGAGGDGGEAPVHEGGGPAGEGGGEGCPHGSEYQHDSDEWFHLLSCSLVWADVEYHTYRFALIEPNTVFFVLYMTHCCECVKPSAAKTQLELLSFFSDFWTQFKKTGAEGARD